MTYPLQSKMNYVSWWFEGQEEKKMKNILFQLFYSTFHRWRIWKKESWISYKVPSSTRCSNGQQCFKSNLIGKSHNKTWTIKKTKIGRTCSYKKEKKSSPHDSDVSLFRKTWKNLQKQQNVQLVSSNLFKPLVQVTALMSFVLLPFWILCQIYIYM